MVTCKKLDFVVVSVSFFCKLKKFGDSGSAHLQEDLDFIVLGVVAN
jgi:hypothetical protein